MMDSLLLIDTAVDISAVCWQLSMGDIDEVAVDTAGVAGNIEAVEMDVPWSAVGGSKFHYITFIGSSLALLGP